MLRERRLFMGNETYADFSIGTSPALEKGVIEGISPDTFVLNIFPGDSLTVGVLDDPEKAVNLDFCRQEGIVVRRRTTTGGTIHAARGAAFIGFYIRSSDPLVPRRTGEALPRILKNLVAAAQELFQIPARYRPLNEVEVAGRRLIAASCRIEGGALLFRMLLNVRSPDPEVLSRAILRSPEKNEDQLPETVRERNTDLEQEAGRAIALAELQEFLFRAVQRFLGEGRLVPGGLDPQEEIFRREFRQLYSRESWFLANSETYRFRQAPPSARRGEYRVRTPAGLIRAVLLKQEGRIYDLILTGDFHPRPHTILSEMESVLKGVPDRPEGIGRRIAEVCRRPGVEVSGMDPEDFVCAVIGALRKAI